MIVPHGPLSGHRLFMFDYGVVMTAFEHLVRKFLRKPNGVIPNSRRWLRAIGNAHAHGRPDNLTPRRSRLEDVSDSREHKAFRNPAVYS
jgi:hypothetical protein